LTIALAVVAAGLFVYQFVRSKSDTSGSPTTAPIANKSIAVLPFDNLSHDPENAYFAEGVQDEILTRLAKIADLKVISRTSTQRFKSAPANLPDIAKQLGVTNILEGSVQKSADQVRVSVQLINAMTDAHLWAEIYDRKLTDVFAVESDIAKTIAETLRAKLTGAEQSAIAVRPTDNSEAHDLYLRGRYFLAKRRGDDLKRAIDYFNQAVAKDPNYALAYAGLADSYIILPECSNEPSGSTIPKARAAAEKSARAR
jgi:TolB-like protein